MPQDPHPLIKRVHEADGNPRDAHIDPEQFRTHQSAKFALITPRKRVYHLSELENAMAAQDGTTLKSKAQLLQLHRELRRTHEQLLAMKR
jgi:hypothetical protein